jgi:ssDNA-binding Zn-finger/Zn-ribbon topoisomerase 1
VSALGLRIMADGRSTKFSFFNCPNCQALYQLIKQAAAPKYNERQITCRACGASLPAREGKFALKYLMLREAARVQRWRRPRNPSLRK